MPANLSGFWANGLGPRYSVKWLKRIEEQILRELVVALIGDFAGHMKGIPERIAKLQIEHFTKADPAYGRGVAEALGLAVEEPELASAN